MPSTEDRINARKAAAAAKAKVKAGDRDYLNPFVHVRETVIGRIKELAHIASVVTLLGTPQSRLEALAYAKALRLIMERFPEIDWGTQPTDQGSFTAPTSPSFN